MAWSLFCVKPLKWPFHPVTKGRIARRRAQTGSCYHRWRSYPVKALAAHSLPGQKFRPLWLNDLPTLATSSEWSVGYVPKVLPGKGNTWVLFCSLPEGRWKNQWSQSRWKWVLCNSPEADFPGRDSKYSFPSSAYPTYLEFFDVCGFYYIFAA